MATQSQTHSPRSLRQSESSKRTATAVDQLLEERLYRRLDQCGTSAHYFKKVNLRSSSGMLRVSGQVPTLGLKKLLWNIVCEEVDDANIVDELDVICATGLSVIHAK